MLKICTILAGFLKDEDSPFLKYFAISSFISEIGRGRNFLRRSDDLISLCMFKAKCNIVHSILFSHNFHWNHCVISSCSLHPDIRSEIDFVYYQSGKTWHLVIRRTRHFVTICSAVNFDVNVNSTIFSKFLSVRCKILLCNVVRSMINPIYPGLYESLFTLLQKIPRTCQMGLKHGRVSKGGLNITLNQKKVSLKVLWMSQTHLENLASDHATSWFCPILLDFRKPF